jgi:autotransporter-associated beta strand protein
MRKPLAKLSKAVLMTAAALISCAPAAKAQPTYWKQGTKAIPGAGGFSVPQQVGLDSAWIADYNLHAAGAFNLVNFEDATLNQVFTQGSPYSTLIGGVNFKFYRTDPSAAGDKITDGASTWSVPAGLYGYGMQGTSSFVMDFVGRPVKWFSFYINDLEAKPVISYYLDDSVTVSGQWNLTTSGGSDANDFLGLYVPGGFSKIKINVAGSGGWIVDYIRFSSSDGVLYWNGFNPASASPSGGTGIWDSSRTNWLPDLFGSAPSQFVSDKPVVFGGPTYPSGNSVVTLASNYQVGSITIDTANYVIGGVENQGVITITSGQLATNQSAVIQSRLGGAQITKTGSGKLTLTGDSTLPNFSVNASGVLQLGLFDSTVPALTQGGISFAQGLSGSLDANITLGQAAELKVYRANSLEYSKVISMTGTAATLTKDGAGTLFLTNTSDVSVVRINSAGGALSFGKGSLSGAVSTSGVINRDIIDNGSLWFNRTDSLSFTNVITGTGSVVKKAAGNTATGMLTLTGSTSSSGNTYTGGTTIEAGILRAASGVALPTGAVLSGGGGKIDIWDGAELRFDHSDDMTNKPLEGVISSVTITTPTPVKGGVTVRKMGTGKVALQGENSYTGNTIVENGWLIAANGSALGEFINYGTTVQTGATLALRGAIVVSERISIAGEGYKPAVGGRGDGAIRSISANPARTGDLQVNTLVGLVTMTADSLISSVSDSLAIKSLTATPGKNLTVNAAGDTGTVEFYETIDLSSGKIIKDGGGIARISGVASYKGGLLIKSGQFDAFSASSLGQNPLTGPHAAVDVGEAGGSATSVLNLGLHLNYAGTITLHNGAITGAHVLTSLGHDFELRNGTVSSSLAGAVGIRKASDYVVSSNTTIPGTVIISRAGYFTGLASVEAGTLKITNGDALGDLTSGTSVNSGATLEFSNDISVAEQVTIAGSGVSSVGALRNSSGKNTLTSQLTLSADSTVQVDAGSTLNLAGVSAVGRTFTANVINSGSSLGVLELGGPVSMLGGKIVKVGTGTLNLNAANDFIAGDGIGLDVQAGTARANHVSALGLGRVQVGTASTGAILDIGMDVTLNNTLTLLHGTVSSGKIYGQYTLTATHFDLRDGIVSASLFGSAGLDKTTADGVVTLWGNNTYTGQTNVTGGLLLVGSNGLGATGAGNDTVVGYDSNLHTWGTLALRRSAKVANEVITIAGDGYDKLGALRTYDDGGIEEVVRDIVIADVNVGGLNRARINNYDADQGNNGDEALVLAGISGVNQDLFFGAWKSTGDSDGKIFVNGSISLGSGKLVSELASSSGVLTLSGANTFSGGTEIRSGKLVAAHPDAMGSGPIIVGTWNFLPTEEGQATAAGSRTGTFRTEALLQNLGNITLVNGVLEGLYAISSPVVELQRGQVNVSLAGSGRVRKTTASTVSLSVANTYDGETRVEGGILDLLNSSALGSVVGSTYVDAGGTLRLGKSKLNISDEQLFLNGQGVVVSSIAQGALNVTGNASNVSGAINLQSNSRINSDVASFSLSGPAPISYVTTVGSPDTGYDLYLGGKGNIDLSKALQLGTGRVIKDGTGKLYMSTNESVEGVSLVKGTTVLSGATITIQAAGFTVGATAALAGYGTIAGDLLVKSGTTAALTPGNPARSPAAGTWTLNTGNLTFEGAAKVVFNANAASHALVPGFLIVNTEGDPSTLPPTPPSVSYDYSKAGGGVAPISVTGDIKFLSSPQTINLSFAGVRSTPGVYKIFEYTGSVIGGDFSGIGYSPFKVAGIKLGVRQNANFRTNLIPANRSAGDKGYLTLEVSNGDLYWRGENTNEWDLSKSNWFLSGSVAASRVKFLQSDAINFDDSATGSTNIRAVPYSSLLKPVWMAFNNTNNAVTGKDYRIYRADIAYTLGCLVRAETITVGDDVAIGKRLAGTTGTVTLSTATSIVEGTEDDNNGFYLYDGWVKAGHDEALGGLRVILNGGRLSAEGSASRSLAVTDAFYLNSDSVRFGSSTDTGTLKLVSDVVMDPTLNGVIATDSTLELAAGIIARDSTTGEIILPGRLIKRGASELIISGTAYDTQIFGEALSVQEGTLQLGNGSDTGWVDASAGITISAGAKLAFNHSGNPYATSRDFDGTITGAGSFQKLGTDRLSLNATDSVIGGGVVVTSGNLAVNPGAGSLTANVTVGANGILSGSGRIIGDVFINGGRHEPGNSPGLVTYNNLTYAAGSAMRWELKDNHNQDDLQRTGIQYFDQIHVTQNLTFAGQTRMELSFQPTGSTVKWDDSFWSSVQTWKVYQVDGTLSGFPSNFSILVQDWQDSSSASLSSQRFAAKFNLELGGDGNDIILRYVPYGARIPESTLDSGYVHVGGTFPIRNFTAYNTSAGTSDVILTNPSSNVTTVNGSKTGITTSDSSLSARLNSTATVTAGFKTGTLRAEFTNQPGNVDAGTENLTLTGTVIDYARPVIGLVDFGSIRRSNPTKSYAGNPALAALNQTFASQHVEVTNATDPVFGERLQMDWKAGSAINAVLPVLTSPVIVGKGLTDQSLSATLNTGSSPGVVSGSAKLTLTSMADTAVTGLSNTSLADGNVSMTGKVYYHAYGEIVTPADPSATIDFGKVRQNGVFGMRTVSVRNDVGSNAADSAYYEKLGGRFADSTPGVLATGTFVHLAWNDPALTAMQITLSSAAPGRINGTTSLVFVTEGDGTVAMPSAEVNRHVFNVTGEVYASARIDAETVDLGRKHENDTFTPAPVAIANYQDGPAAYVDHLDVGVVASPTLEIYGASSLTNLVAGSSADTSVLVKLKDSYAQHYNLYNETLTLTGISKPTDGVTGPFALANKSVVVQALVYSGKSHWLGGLSAGQVWTRDSWALFPQLEGVPGRDGILSVRDEVVFGGSVGGARTVTLSGYNPELAKMSFGGNVATTLQPGTGGEFIKLGGNGLTEAAGIHNGAGYHDVNVHIELYQDLVISAFGQQMVFNPAGENAITQVVSTSARQLTLIGGGQLGFLRPIVGDSGVSTWRMNALLQGPTMLTVSQNFEKLEMEDGQIATAKYLDGDTTPRVVWSNSAEKTTAGTVRLGTATQLTRSEANWTHFSGNYSDLPVKAGALYNNAVVDSSITVWNGAKLGGVGYSGDIRVLSGGTLAPGNSIGDITTTALNIAQGATYNVEFNGNGADKTIVTAPGGATLRGSVLVSFYPGSIDVASKVFTIIEHPSGIYDITPDSLADPARDFVKNGVYFDDQTALDFPSLTPMLRTFSDHTELYFALYRNLGEPRTISSVPNIMGRTQSMFVHSITGDPYARLLARGPSAAQGITQNSLLSAKDNLDESISGAQDNTWLEGYSQVIQAKQGSGLWGYDFQLGGVSAGIDLMRENDWVMGLAFGLSQSESKHEYKGDKTTSTAYDIGLYTAASGDDSTVSFVAFYSSYDLTHTRFVEMGITTKPATGKPKAFRTGIELDYDKNVFRTPDSKTYLRMGLGAGLTHRNGFTETGDEAIAMNFDAINMPYFQLDIGMGYSTDLFEGDKTWQLFGEGMFTRHVVGSNPTCQARFVNPVGVSGEVTVPSPEYTYIQFQPSMGVSWREGLNSAEFKVFAEIRGGKTAPGASASYKLRF